MWINKYGQLSSSQTDELKRAHKAIDAAYPVFLALIISGPVLAVTFRDPERSLSFPFRSSPRL